MDNGKLKVESEFESLSYLTKCAVLGLELKIENGELRIEN
jgi:hypothetical protein